MSNRNKIAARLRVLVAEDNTEMRDKIVQLLRPDFDIVGSAGDGVSAYDAVLLLEPDIVVLDISMPAMSGIEAARKLAKNGSKTKTLFLTVHADPDFVRTAFKVGASGYVVKSQMATDLLVAMEAAVEGRHFVSPSCALKEQ
jgi:DNA-binding NarL/FixJ family response regulator